MKQFLKLTKDERLDIDRILFESYYPILFSCKSNLNEHYICVCCKNNTDGIKWLIGKTDVNNIIMVLENNITLRELFLRHTESKISVDYKDGKYNIEYNNSDWNDDSIYLPKPDSYMDAEPGEFDDDILYYKNENNKIQCNQEVTQNYLGSFYDNCPEVQLDCTKIYFVAPSDCIILKVPVKNEYKSQGYRIGYSFAMTSRIEYEVPKRTDGIYCKLNEKSSNAFV